MRKRISLATASLCLLAPAYAAFAGSSEPPSKIFLSENKRYKVQVEYDDWGGRGSSVYRMEKQNGSLISEFKTDDPPLVVFVSNRGNYLVAYSGAWDEEPYLNKLLFYSSTGQTVKRYECAIPLVGPICYGAKLSKGGNIFAVGLHYDLQEYLKSKKIEKANLLVLFDVSNGEIVRQINLKGIAACEASFVISKDEKWIVVCGSTGEGWNERIVVLSISGKKKWEKHFPQKKLVSSLIVLDVSPDGSRFVVEDRGKEEKRYYYDNDNGKVKLRNTAKLNEELMLEAMGLISNKEYAAALEKALRLVQIDSTSAKAHKLLGGLYELLNDMPKSRLAYEKALELNPADESLRIYLESWGRHVYD